jgi:spore germination protein GerM
MTPRQRDIIMYSSLAVMLAVGLIALLLVGPRWLATTEQQEAAAPASDREVRKIHARLLYVAEDGLHLVPVEQEVVYGDNTVEQAKRILEAQVAQPKAPLVSSIPPGTTIKTVFLTQKGEAYIDLSPEVRANHPGGSTNEILTVYALVGALMLNLPAVTGVQILVDGKEVDTLAGHLDLRRPLEQDERWIGQ